MSATSTVGISRTLGHAVAGGYAALLMVSLTLWVSVACGKPRGATDSDTPTPGKANEFSHYWLGESFLAVGEVFRGPVTDEMFGGDVAGERLSIQYFADRCCSDLRLTTYSKAAWQQEQARRGPSWFEEADQSPVLLDGRDATLVRRTDPIQPIVSIFVIMDDGDLVLEASTSSQSSPGGAESNLLVGTDLLIGVLQDVRLYPE